MVALGAVVLAGCGGDKRGAGPQSSAAENPVECEARAGVGLGLAQSVIAADGADVPCALRRLRRTMNEDERVAAAKGRLSDKAAAALAEAINACD